MTECKFCLDINEPGLFKPHKPCGSPLGGRCEACVKTEQLELQMAEAKKAMGNLFEQHRELRTQMNRAHDQLIQRVPLEVVSCIFQSFATLEGNPLILGSVCRAWRQLAWSTPSLWTAIDINAERHSTPSCRQVAVEWLDRSRQFPLSVRLRTPLDNKWHDKKKNEEGLCDLISIINRFSTRWQSLDVEMINVYFTILCEDSQPGNILRTLRLNNPSNNFATPPAEFQMPGPKPRPEDVSLTYLDLKRVHIEWDNVTRAELIWCQVDDALEILRRAPRLQTCTVLISGVPRLALHFPIPSEPVVHDQITDLTCKFAHVANFDDCVVTFFEKTSLPRLERFAYVHRQASAKWDRPEFPAWAILSFFKRSSSLLRELVIARCLIDDNQLVPILRELPSLHILDLSPAYTDSYVPDDLFSLLARTAVPTKGREIFLPELQHVLEIFGPLSAIGQSGTRPLKAVHIRVPRKDNPSFSFIGESEIHDIVSVLEKGLDLQILDKDTNADLVQASVAQIESSARRSARRRSKR
ncbi:hypothetical protein CVT26_010263 [Gymnopilus dilepis]|uniref:Uncharacterized protein n=1 Tax=Gymnopilus dilepis TaxID=231916 RepID=A0A409Y128_9AGAR|nr:hypothetical protein CVT26_010263 [Gymnopilus dilepis]